MRGSILIVHDDVGVRRGVGEFLASQGYRVLTAETSHAALAVLEENVPALLIIGVGLPLLSGWKLVEALAHYPDLSPIPRLLVGADEPLAAVCGRALRLLETRHREANENAAKAKAAQGDVVPDAAATESANDGAGPRRVASA